SEPLPTVPVPLSRCRAFSDRSRVPGRRCPVGIFELSSWALAVVFLVTVIWPLNVPLLALAYKVRHGGGPLPLEPGSFWLRTTFAALGLFLMTWVLVGLNFLLVDTMALPDGPVHL